MKKMMYSNFTKFIAVVLCIASIVAGAWIATNGLYRYSQEERRVYQFENNFSESLYLTQLLREPEIAIVNAYGKSWEDSILRNETLAKNIEEALNSLYCSDKINYYVWWYNTHFTNCGATSPEELMQGDLYSYTRRERTGYVWHESKPANVDRGDVIDLPSSLSGMIITSNIKQEYLDEYKMLWEQQEAMVVGAFTKALFFVLLALLLLIYLICVCGQNKDGELKTMWLDHIWAEVHLAAMFGAVCGVVFLCSFMIDAYWVGRIPSLLTNLVIGGALPLASAVVITSLLSIIRNIKCRRFAETSIILRMAKRCWRVLLKVSKWFYGKLKSFKEAIFYALSKKTGSIFITTLVVYTALIVACSVIAFVNFRFLAFWILLGILVLGFACFVVSYRAKDTDEIKKGVSQVRNGNTAYKIPALKSSDLNLLAEDINDISKGLDESVSARVKAERLKTELITNISHDLKTPITSIISYTVLLSKMEELPEEAKDYVQVISKKGERLKNLTQDLFDISKAQSGNEEVVLEKLDVSLLVQQSLAEYESEIQKSELPFCVDVSKELYILADGRKMSRVVSNLINNILKYSLKGTRAFITASEKDEEIVVEFKNIASYPMDFSADEIVGRFVRGDESRTTEGNGLGLAIAKSYTEICNGKFEVVIDGDLFKAILRFKQFS